MAEYKDHCIGIFAISAYEWTWSLSLFADYCFCVWWKSRRVGCLWPIWSLHVSIIDLWMINLSKTLLHFIVCWYYVRIQELLWKSLSWRWNVMECRLSVCGNTSVICLVLMVRCCKNVVSVKNLNVCLIFLMFCVSNMHVHVNCVYNFYFKVFFFSS